jgi:hypothetical protein
VNTSAPRTSKSEMSGLRVSPCSAATLAQLRWTSSS